MNKEKILQSLKERKEFLTYEELEFLIMIDIF